MPRHISMVLKPRRANDKKKEKAISTPITPPKVPIIHRVDSLQCIPTPPRPQLALATASPTPVSAFPLDLSALPFDELHSAASENLNGLGTAYPSSEALPIPDEVPAPKKPQTPASKRTSFTSIGKWRDGVAAEHGPRDSSLAQSTQQEATLAIPEIVDSVSEEITLGGLELLFPAVYESTKPNLSVIIPSSRRPPVETVPMSASQANRPIVSRYNPSAAPSVVSSATPPLPATTFCAQSAHPALQQMTVQSAGAEASPSSQQVRSVRSASPASVIRPHTSHSRPSRSSATSSVLPPSEHGEDSSRYNYTSTSSRTSLESVPRHEDESSVRRPLKSIDVRSANGTPSSTVSRSGKSRNLNKALPPSPGPGAEEFIPRIRSGTHTPRPLNDVAPDSAPLGSADKSSATFDSSEDTDAASVYSHPTTVDEAYDSNSPTFMEAVFALQRKLGQLAPLETEDHAASPRLSTAPSDTRYSVASPYSRANAQSLYPARNSTFPHLATIEQADKEDEDEIDHFDAAIKLEVPSRKPSKHGYARDRLSRASVSSASSYYPPLTPASVSRRRSTSDVSVRSSMFVPAIRRSSLYNNPPSAVRAVPELPRIKLEIPQADEPATTRSSADATPVQRHLHSRTASCDAPQVVASKARPRSTRLEPPPDSARLSVMVPVVHVDDGLIVVDDERGTVAAAEGKKAKPGEPRAAELVLLRIMANLPSLRDLVATSMINKGMRRVYWQNELYLLRAALENDSLPAWELREWSVPASAESPTIVEMARDQGFTAASYKEAIIEDRAVWNELKIMILERCQSFLRQETVEALSAPFKGRSKAIEDAFYRIWCFCKIFGGARGRDDDVTAQIDWFKGGLLAHQDGCQATCGVGMDFDMSSVLLNPPDHFGVCNADSLTAEQLFDMTEIWNCLSALLQNYLPAVRSASKYGILDQANLFVPVSGASQGDNGSVVLEEWISYTLSLGPKTIIELARRAHDVELGFEYARSQGWTVWPLPSYTATRSTFLKEPVSRMYEERLATRPPQLTDSRLRSMTDADDREASRRRVASMAREIRMARCKSNFQRLPLIDMSLERPWSVASRSTMATIPKTPIPASPAPPLSATSIYEDSEMSFKRPAALRNSEIRPAVPALPKNLETAFPAPTLPAPRTAQSAGAVRLSTPPVRPARPESPPMLYRPTTPPRPARPTTPIVEDNGEELNLLLTPMAYKPPTSSRATKSPKTPIKQIKQSAASDGSGNSSAKASLSKSPLSTATSLAQRMSLATTSSHKSSTSAGLSKDRFDKHDRHDKHDKHERHERPKLVKSRTDTGAVTERVKMGFSMSQARAALRISHIG